MDKTTLHICTQLGILLLGMLRQELLLGVYGLLYTGVGRGILTHALSDTGDYCPSFLQGLLNSLLLILTIS